MAVPTNFSIPNWLIELIKRFFTKKPAFFKVLQIISGIATVLVGLPVWLESMGVSLPEAWQAIATETVGWISLVITVIAQLTTDTSKVKDPSKTLPFTTQNK
jgi:hypothetical protein